MLPQKAYNFPLQCETVYQGKVILGIEGEKAIENGTPNFDQPSFQRKIFIKRNNVKKLIQAHSG